MSAYITARDHLLQGPLGDSVATFAVAGAVAEVAGSAIRLPMEVAKLRLQLGAYSNSFQAFKDILMNPWRLTRGFVPQTIMHDCSYSACGWLFFESGRQWLYSLRGSSNLPVYENLLLGFAAGTLTSLVTNPFDVIKTRIIGSSSETPPGILSTAKSIWRFEGLGAFWQGASLRLGQYRVTVSHRSLSKKGKALRESLDTATAAKKLAANTSNKS
ncbi:Probable S-adenosylmethionine carrier 2 [Durusdinium trenchii]